jgi:8-oxo-dGTP diphosphatase
MVDLQQFQAKVCLTAAGCLVYKNQVLLVKHKKLGIWLNPGGHLEANELPHQTAEREFWEETGVKVKAVSQEELFQSQSSEYLPNPFVTSLHWVSETNYKARLNGEKDSSNTNPWKNGCEQHVNLLYMVEPIDKVEFTQNQVETDGIAWFSKTEVQELETSEDIKKEIAQAFSFYEKRSRNQKS